jgi:hypothetical protein
MEHKMLMHGDKMENKNQIIHYPNLRTVIMVEKEIKEQGTITKTGLFKSLKNRVMWQTLEVILDYLCSRRLIVYDKKGKIVWIHNPKLRKIYANRPDLRVKL